MAYQCKEGASPNKVPLIDGSSKIDTNFLVLKMFITRLLHARGLGPTYHQKWMIFNMDDIYNYYRVAMI